MAKKSFKPSNVELRYKTYYAVFYVPKDVQHTLGRTKFTRSTETGDRALAERRASAFVTSWKAFIADATHQSPDPVIADALSLHAELTRHPRSPGLVEDFIDEMALEIGAKDAHAAQAFELIATGKRKPLSTLISSWKSHEVSRKLRTKTIDQMVADVSPLASDLKTAHRMDERTCSIWINYIATSQKLTASSVTRIVGSCRNFYRYLKSIGEVSGKDSDVFVIPVEYRKSKRHNAKAGNRTISWKAFTDDQVVVLHAEALIKRDQLLADLIFLGAYTGARIEEICSLKCLNVSLTATTFDIVDAKTEAGVRVVPLHSSIQFRVTTLVEESKDGYLLSGLTFNKYGDRSNAIGKRFGRLKNALEFDRTLVFHSIRKTFTTMLENAGTPENIAADIIGHDKPNMTYGIYSGGASLKTKRAAIEHVSYRFQAEVY